jgi:hypothetical protein
VKCEKEVCGEKKKGWVVFFLFFFSFFVVFLTVFRHLKVHCGDPPNHTHSLTLTHKQKQTPPPVTRHTHLRTHTQVQFPPSLSLSLSEKPAQKTPPTHFTITGSHSHSPHAQHKNTNQLHSQNHHPPEKKGVKSWVGGGVGFGGFWL